VVHFVADVDAVEDEEKEEEEEEDDSHVFHYDYDVR
jgi:hypothetical protein